MRRSWVPIIVLAWGLAGGAVLGMDTRGARVDSGVEVLDPSAAADRRLLRGYWQITTSGGEPEEDTQWMRYFPWQFDVGADLFFDEDAIRWVVEDPGEYAGWDYLATRHSLHANVNYSSTMDYVFLRLERDASVAVVWYGSESWAPAWLRAWDRGGDVRVKGKSRITFRTTLRAGEHYLGTVGGKSLQMYTVLLAEADGQPSPLPRWEYEGERVAPNTPIPRDHILHNVHFAQGPDGKTYPTWHEQIDTRYWVYFEHEHGSDPAEFAGFPEVQPVWAYTDPSIGDDGFFAFKVVTLDAVGDDGREYSFMFTFHIESLTRNRLCERYHTLDVAIADTVTGEVLVRLHHLADTGFAQGVRPDGATRIRPAECPEVANIVSAGGRRNVNTNSGGAYESWQYDLGAARALPFLGGVSFLMESYMTFIGTATDSNGYYTASTLHERNDARMGSARHLQFAGNFFGVDARQGTWGEFCTDRYGRERVACGPDTVRQYVKPGIRIAIPKGEQPRYGVRDPWTVHYEPQPAVGGIINVWRNLEHAISFDFGRN